MASRRIVVDPITRIEGHLRIETEIKDNLVTGAKVCGDMFRGIEKALIGYDARTAQQVTQRVCGVCPYAHAEASSLALENAMGIKPNRNGQLLRNLVVGSYQLQDHLLHFYHLSALDFIDVTAVLKYQGKDAALNQVKSWVQEEINSKKIFPAAPLLPRYKANYSSNDDFNISAVKDYLSAFKIMSSLHKMVAVFGAKAPHPVANEAGGITTMPNIDNLALFRSLLESIESFVTNNYYQDVLGVAGEFPEYFKEGLGPGRLLSYPYYPDVESRKFSFSGGTTIDGAFSSLDLTKITEDQSHAFYKSDSSNRSRPLDKKELNPLSEDEFNRERYKDNGKYSWIKSPRYQGDVVEVGAVARLTNTVISGVNPALTGLVNKINKQTGLKLKNYQSVMGRHLSRMLISQIILKNLKRDLELVEPGKTGYTQHKIPANARGVGLTEGSRGALGHWIETDKNGLIANYEMIVPSTWNFSPKDSNNQHGAVEQMLIGTKVEDAQNPIELSRIVRSSDPCIACAVH